MFSQNVLVFMGSCRGDSTLSDCQLCILGWARRHRDVFPDLLAEIKVEKKDYEKWLGIKNGNMFSWVRSTCPPPSFLNILGEGGGQLDGTSLMHCSVMFFSKLLMASMMKI